MQWTRIRLALAAHPRRALAAVLLSIPMVPAAAQQEPVAPRADFELEAKKLVPGLYQVAYSPKCDRLFVTSAVGRPPVKQSQLVKVNPATLEVEASVSAAKHADADDSAVFAVYGVAVDDARDTVWVTNTRDNTVAVYKQSDLSLVKQLEPGAAKHARDVIVDEIQGKAFVSEVGSNAIAVFDAVGYKPLGRIALESPEGDAKFVPMSLELDPERHRLYVVSMGTDELAILDTATDKVVKVLPLPGARGASGVALDPKTNRLFVASQQSGNLLILDAASGDVIQDVPTGAGALNVAFDPVHRLAYVANRGAGTVTVVDPDGKVVASLDGGTSPNHVHEDGKGHIFAVNKARGQDDPNGDRISRISPRP
jgi:DNA-binding beta-propeller fold protein YncE